MSIAVYFAASEFKEIKAKFMYLSDNNDLRVAVVPKYHREDSTIHNSCWEYSVFIENRRVDNVQLVGQYYQFIYDDGSTHEIMGIDEDGDAIIIEPGTILESKSRAWIKKSSSAIVKGHYVMYSKGEEFDVEIPSFSLDNPYQTISIN